ncbi:hypothetical protein GCM10027592_58360 [Spirosoma flavus]
MSVAVGLEHVKVSEPGLILTPGWALTVTLAKVIAEQPGLVVPVTV